MAVMDAMLLAYGISDKAKLDELTDVGGVVKEDPDFVKELVGVMKQHWESQSKELENCRYRK